jgi:CRP-like cAMP-binding protein
MLTGTPSVAQIVALTPVVVYELGKADITPILTARPQVSQELCRALAQRQAKARAIGTAEVDESVPTNRLTSWFAERINRLYEIASAT